jgi:hypothetical protein
VGASGDLSGNTTVQTVLKLLFKQSLVGVRQGIHKNSSADAADRRLELGSPSMERRRFRLVHSGPAFHAAPLYRRPVRTHPIPGCRALWSLRCAPCAKSSKRVAPDAILKKSAEFGIKEDGDWDCGINNLCNPKSAIENHEGPQSKI